MDEFEAREALQRLPEPPQRAIESLDVAQFAMVAVLITAAGATSPAATLPATVLAGAAITVALGWHGRRMQRIDEPFLGHATTPLIAFTTLTALMTLMGATASGDVPIAARALLPLPALLGFGWYVHAITKGR